MFEFTPFRKIPRFSREIVILEKLDGTNASVFVYDDGEVRFGKRTSFVTPDDDNHGFARWATDHIDELRQLGPGKHYGEWWGSGIQRRYGLKEKRFSLFNVARWEHERPACCDVVPVLYRGPFCTTAINDVLADLKQNGSRAAPGFLDPEGIVIFHTASGQLFKKTLDNDDAPKGVTA